MSAKSDPGQGMVPDPKRPAAIPVAEPDNGRQFREIQRGVNAADRASTASKPRPPERDRQDWRRG